MAKELPYFKFDISEWMFGRIQKQPESIQGMFINLCCKYWHKLGEYSQGDAERDFGADRIKKLLDKDLIGSEGGYIYVKFLDVQLDECDQTSKKNSIKGLKSAHIRAQRKQQSTTVQPQLTSVQPSSTEEKRREENKKEKKRKELPASPFVGEVLKSWDEWIQYRTEIKKKLSASTAEKQIQFLGGRAGPEIIEIINKSITQGWTGLFELNGNKNNGKNRGANNTTGEVFREQNYREAKL